ncbi:MAG TPA: AsmA-like C-terminal region-containing protein, partial [Kiloniellales bacterium]|nr:AsmA-like C-terminal region-containing protein [Kiloniellales bacterium]
SQLSLDAESFAARDLSLALGPSRGTGEIVYTLGEAPTLTARLNFPQLNLDELIAQATPPGADLPEAQPGTESAAGEAPATLLPPGLTGTFELGVTQLTYRGQVVQDVVFAADIANDKATLRDIAMQLPGPSTLALSGEVALANGEPAFVGHLELASDRLRDLLSWVGVDVAGVPADRLGRFDLVTDVNASGQQLALSDLAIELDSTRASGGVVLAMGDRPGVGLGLAIDRLNVDAYMPAGAGDSGTGGGQAAAGGDPLAAFDANLDLRIGSLTYQGVPVGDVRVVGSLQSGTFRFDELKLGVIAGGSLSYTGTLAPAEPRFDGTLMLSSNKPEELAMLAGLDPAMLAQIGPFDLSADLAGTPEDLDVNATLAALGGDFAAAGRLTGGTASTLKLTAQHPNVARLAEALGQPGVVPAGFGGIDASSTVALSKESVTLSDLAGQVGPLAIKRGSLTATLAGRPRIDADLATGVIDLGALTGGGGDGGSGGGGGGERWSSESLGLEGLRDFDAKVKLAADAIVQGETRIENAVVDLTLENGLLTIQQLEGVMNGGQLSATGTVDARQTPRLDAQFTLNGMQLGPFFEGVFPVGKPKGVVNATGQLGGDASSMASLMASLTGAVDAGGRFNLDTGGAGVLGGQGLQVGGQVLTDLLGDQAKQLGQIKNVTDGAALLVQAVADHDSPFVAQIDLQDGRAQLQQVEVQGRGLTAKAEGYADLAPWTGDILLNVFLNDRPDEPYYQEHRVGLLDDPDQIDRSGLLLTGEAPEALPEAEAPTPLEEALPEELQSLVPEGTEDLTQQLPEEAQDLVEGLTGGEATEAPSDTTGEQQAEQPAEQATEPQAEEQQAEEPAEETGEQQAEQPAEETEEQQAEQPAEETEEQQAEQPAEETQEQQAEQPAEETTEEQTQEQQAEEEQQAEPLTEQQAEQPAEQQAEQPAEETTEQPAETQSLQS